MFSSKNLLRGLAALAVCGSAAIAAAQNWSAAHCWVFGETVWNSSSTAVGGPDDLYSITEVDNKTFSYAGLSRCSCGLFYDPNSGTIVGTGYASDNVVFVFRVVWEVTWNNPNTPMPDSAYGVAEADEDSYSSPKPYGLSMAAAAAEGDYAYAKGMSTGIAVGADYAYTVVSTNALAPIHHPASTDIPLSFNKVFDSGGNPHMIATYDAGAMISTYVGASCQSAPGHGASARSAMWRTGTIYLKSVNGQPL